MNKVELTNLIKSQSQNLGFNLVGISNPEKINNDKLEYWFENGYDASMSWIKKRTKERKNIFKYFPQVKSIISFGCNYYTGKNDLNSKKLKISNYAWGDDYHEVIKKKLYLLVDIIKEYHKDLDYRVCVDTSPILEKYWAQRGGLGWIGKHTNLINDNLGSWFFLGEVLLDIELNYSEAFQNDLCGTCTKCIEACPTDAIIDDYILDSNKCISYLTIEHRGKIVEEFSEKLNSWIYGCDICQQVCPWNIKFGVNTKDNSFSKRDNLYNMSNEDWENLDKNQFRKLFKKSAVKRTKYEGLKRNISENLKNSKT